MFNQPAITGKIFITKNRKKMKKAIRQQVYDKCNGNCAYFSKPLKLDWADWFANVKNAWSDAADRIRNNQP